MDGLFHRPHSEVNRQLLLEDKDPFQWDLEVLEAEFDPATNEVT
jgi:hypothetical protein